MIHRPSRPSIRMPLDDLRSLLDKADARLGALETSSSADALNLLRLLDEIDALYADLERAGVDLRAEQTRRNTIEQTLRRKAGVLLRLLRPSGGIAAARSARHIPETHWWWYLDSYVAEQRRRQVRATLIGFAVLAAIVGVAALLYNTFFKPDPDVIARMEYMQKAQNAVQQNDLEGALQALDQAVAEFPDDGELLLWRGAILHRLQRQDEAQATFETARSAYDSEVAYLINRSSVRLQAGDIEGAYADGQAAVAEAPDNAQAFLVLGSAQELSGRYGAAIASYQKAAELAAAQKNTQLEAIAKVRLAMLMQTAPLIQVTPQPTPR